MIPKLFNANETDKYFLNNGIGRLSDAISCEVTEERNGMFELEMQYSTTGIHYEDLVVGNIIVVRANEDERAWQAFDIYEITKPINQIVTVRAQHISYRLSYIPVAPFASHGIRETLQLLKSNSLEDNPFTFSTTISNTESTYNQLTAASLRSRLGGVEGSVLDVFGGEYLWDNYAVNLYSSRGMDRGVQLRYGKNITDLSQEESLESTITGALPIWSDSENDINIMGDIQYKSNAGDYAYKRTVVLDLSDQYDTAPTVSIMNQAAQQWLATLTGLPKTNIKVSFVNLSDFDNQNILEQVHLCDTVTVIYTPLNISFKAKVIKTVYDVLEERYTSVEIGEARSSIAKTISDNIGDISEAITAGKKAISVSQKVDREVGTITSTVASVQEIAEGNTSSIEQLSTQIQQTASDVSIQITSAIANADLVTSDTLNETTEGINSALAGLQNESDNQAAQLNSLVMTIRATQNGIEIGKSNSRIQAIYGNSDLKFIDTQNNDEVKAWMDADKGLGATELQLGSSTIANRRWRIYPNDSGTILKFTRRY